MPVRQSVSLPVGHALPCRICRAARPPLPGVPRLCDFACLFYPCPSAVPWDRAAWHPAWWLRGGLVSPVRAGAASAPGHVMIPECPGSAAGPGKSLAIRHPLISGVSAAPPGRSINTTFLSPSPAPLNRPAAYRDRTWMERAGGEDVVPNPADLTNQYPAPASRPPVHPARQAMPHEVRHLGIIAGLQGLMRPEFGEVDLMNSFTLSRIL